jgi:hypothetical protein
MLLFVTYGIELLAKQRKPKIWWYVIAASVVTLMDTIFTFSEFLSYDGRSFGGQ